MLTEPLPIPLFFALWALGGLCWLIGSVFLAGRDGLSRSSMAFALLTIVPFILIGARLHYVLLEEGRTLSALVETPELFLQQGFRLPGGLLLALFAAPLVAFAFQLPFRRFADAAVVFAGLVFAFGRVACFLRGCCFGETTNFPWAAAHPLGSYAHKIHLHYDLVADGAAASLPVHPFGLYLAVTSLGVVALMLILRRYQRYPGEVALAFVAVMSLSAALIETFREIELVRSVPLRMLIPALVGSIAAFVYIGLWNRPASSLEVREVPT